MLTQEQATTLERKIERFSQILAKNPGDGLTVLALAEASFRRGLKLEALTAYQTVTKERSVPEAHLAVAEIYSQQGMTSEAYGELRRLFELDPDNVEARLLIRNLERKSLPPDDILELLRRPASEEAFYEARLRLQIQRAIHNRELQERTRNGTLEPGVVIHEYYIEEAKKKLIEVDELLRKLDDLKVHNATLDDIPTTDPVPAQMDASISAEISLQIEEELASAIQDYNQEDSLAEVDFLEESQEGFQEGAPVEETHESLDGQELVFESPEVLDGTLPPVETSGEDAPSLPDLAETSLSEDPDVIELGLPVSVTSLVEGAEGEGDLASQEVDELEFPPVPPAAGGLLMESQEVEVEELPPMPSVEEETSTESSFHQPIFDESSIELGVPENIVSSIDPELPEVDEVVTLSAEPAEDIPMPTLSDSPRPSDSSKGISDFDVPPAIEPITFEESGEEMDSHPTDTVLEPSVPATEEVSAVSEPVVTSVATAADRQAYYESRAEEIGKLTGTLARTRGVSSIFLVARDGTTIDSVVKDDIAESRVGELVKESFEFLLAYADSPAYWVLECAGGIFVMQTLDDEHVLIAIGQAGANFGALRYTMDKTKAKFEAILQHVPR